MVSTQQVEDRRSALCDWLTANGVDPNRVPQWSDLYVTTDDGAPTLHFELYDIDDNGRLIRDERGDRAAVRDATVPLTVQPPDWWQPHRKPTREQLLEQLAAARAELDALHHGEEVHEYDAIVPTPGQWIWRWNRLTPEQRLEHAARLQDAQARAGRCFFENHDATIADLRSALSARASK